MCYFMADGIAICQMQVLQVGTQQSENQDEQYSPQKQKQSKTHSAEHHP